MDPLVHTTDQETAETVYFTCRICFEEGENYLIGWKGYVHPFLRITMCVPRLSVEGQNGYRALLCRIFDRFDAELQKKRKNKKCKLIQLSYELLLHPQYSPELFSCDNFLFPNLKESHAKRKFESYGGVIATTEAYFSNLQKTQRSIAGQVCLANGKIKRNFSEFFVFLL